MVVSSSFSFKEMFYSSSAFNQVLCWTIPESSFTVDMFGKSLGSVRLDCFKCIAGEYRVDEDTCRLCPSGTYAKQPTSGSSGAVTCTACSNSSDISIKGSDSEIDCRPACGPGLLLAPREDGMSAFCNSSCPPWTKADANGKTCSMKVCGAGSFAIRGVCRLCPAGFYQPISNQTSCDACPGGKYASSEEGAVSCLKCDNATYSTPAATECLFVSCKLKKSLKIIVLSVYFSFSLC